MRKKLNEQIFDFFILSRLCSPNSQVQIILDVGSEAVNNAAVKDVMLSNPDTIVMNSHKLTKALGDELEEFRAALDDLKVKPLPGQFRDVVSGHLKEIDSAVKVKIHEVVTSALNADKNKTDNASKDAVLALDDYKNATKEVATIISDKNIKHKIVHSAQEVMERSADMFLEAQNVLKTPGNQTNAKKLKEAARNIVSVMKELENTYIFGAEGQEQYVSALNIMKHATKELANPSPLGINERPEEVATIKTRLMTSTMEVAQLAQDILTRSHNDPERLDGLTPRLAQQYMNLAGDINSLARVVGEEDSETGDSHKLSAHLKYQLENNKSLNISQAIQRSLVSPDSANETTSMNISTESDKSKGLLNSTSSSTDNPNQDCDNTQDMFDCTFDMSSVLGDGVLCMEKEITPQSSQLTPVKPSNVTLQTETPKFMAEILVNVTPGNPKNDAVILSSAPVAPSQNEKSDEGRGNLKGVNKKKRKSKKVEKEEKKANKKHKIRQYNLAIEAFKDNKFNTYYSCAKEHGVSSATLKRLIVTGKNYVGQGKINKVLKESEQQLLCDHLKEASNIGFGYTYYDLRLTIQELLQGLVTSNPARAETIPWENLWPPLQFAHNFCKKYKLTLRKTMYLSDARAEITPEDVATWAKKIETILARPDYAAILKDPRRVFNNVSFHMFNFFSFLT